MGNKQRGARGIGLPDVHRVGGEGGGGGDKFLFEDFLMLQFN